MPLTDPRPKPPDDTIHLAFNGVQSSYTWACIMWLKVTASTRSGADLATLLTAVRGVWFNRLAGQMVPTCSMNEVKGVWIIPGGGEIVGSNTTAAPGSAAGPALPNLATCAVVNWRIDQYYRGGKPRTYLPGLASSFTTDFVHLTTAQLAAYQTAAGGFLQDMNALTAGAITNVKLGTVSFVQKKDWRNPPVFFPYNGSSIRSVLGTQRKRLLA